ncbi:MAG: lysophospholipid acyltransferase family protein [Ginsengibacter sp.]
MKALRGIYSIYGFFVFVILMLLLFPFVVIASFFGRVTGGNTIYTLCRLWADSWFFLMAIRHTNIYEGALYKGQKIFVSNHISYFDVPVMMKAVRSQNIRILGKSELASIPIFGYIYRKAVVLVNRTSVSKRAASIKVLKSILNKNISIFICPEGTFNTTHKPLKQFYDGAFRIAIETQTPISPILLLDTYDRLHYDNMLSLNPGKSRAVHLPTIFTDGLTLNDIQFLKADVYKKMDEGLRRYHASWIVEDIDLH